MANNLKELVYSTGTHLCNAIKQGERYTDDENPEKRAQIFRLIYNRKTRKNIGIERKK